jgi:hypothetical protein
MNKADQILLHSDVLQALRQEKLLVRQEIKKSSESITRTTQHIFSPVPAASKKATGLGKIISNGIAIYQGFKIVRSFMSVTGSMLRKKK